ncbi:autotransporter-associated beta strand repeat-containing protein [Dyella sp.]|uniref:autotransporter-associated beta strand repeat-containing protein n=1 Tax=Dyella sp. TaxID=1869338 RepID=UPI002ED2EDC0
MNRIYRLVWNRALRTVQVASELSRANHATTAAGGNVTHRHRPLTVAVAGLLLSAVASPAFAVCSPTNVADCGAPGGFNGHPGRNMHGGTGDGTGGSATHRNDPGVPGTAEISGDPTSNGAGGKGADGIENTDPATVAAGGSGGAVGATGSAGLGASVTGGAGQAGASPPTSVDFWAGAGGGGGAGVFVNDDASMGYVASAVVISGGKGGKGGDINSTPNGDAGGGGGGGAGVIVGVGATNVTIGVNGHVNGGNGGSGGNLGYAGSGGGGGDAMLLLGANANINISTGATLQGGAGGQPGVPSPANPPNGGGYAGGYGGGGAGLNMVGSGELLSNAGTINGGSTGGSGVAGVGVRAWGGAGINNSGRIAGGINGDGVQADSVLFSGGGNVLTIVSGATFVGKIQSTSGTTNGGDVVSLNGTASGSFDAGQLVGFATGRKEGSSNWTLTGNGDPGTNWVVRSGQLIGNTNSIAGNLTFSATSSTLGVDFNQSVNGTFGGTISGAGSLLKDGIGTLTLSGNVSGYSGQFLINQGIVALTGAGDMHGADIQGSNFRFDVSQISGAFATVAGLSGDGTVNLGTRTLVFNNATAGSDDFQGVISGTGGITLNSGTQELSGANTYSGDTQINGGTLIVDNNGQIGQGQSALNIIGGTLDASGVNLGSTLDVKSLAGSGNLVLGTTTLNIDSGDSNFLGEISGFSGINVNGGLLTLSGVNTYTGDTLVQNGGLDLVGNGTIGNQSRIVLNNSTLDLRGVSINRTVSQASLAGSGTVRLGSAMTLQLTGANDTFSGVISGAGNLAITTGREVLDGNNTYSGGTSIDSNGTLIVGDAGSSGAAIGGDANVIGGTLGGNGTIHGNVVVSAGGTLAPGDIFSLGTLTVGGNLTINDGSQLDFDLAAPGPNFSTPGQGDHILTDGNLIIGASSLNISDLGMGPGLYNLFKWGGSLQFNNGGFQAPQGMSIQILSGDKQINLIDSQGLTLDLWDANGLASPNSMGGGSGTWSVDSSNWTNTNGETTGPMSPQPGFAIFGGASGTVNIDNTDGAVTATGLQFMTDGYRLDGDAITLIGQNGNAPVIRVSDGATAIIDSVISSNIGINKTDGGTLVLNGANLYAGNTTLSGGELAVSSDENLGQAADAIDFEGGTLKITGNSFHATDRQIIWGNAGGGFDIADASNTFTVSQDLGGAGGLYKMGAGTLVLTGNNSYTGDTTIAQGTLQGNTLSLHGNMADNGTLVFDQSFDDTYTGAITGNGQLVKTGTGVLTLSGVNAYAGGTSILAGGLAGSTTSLQGNVLDNGQLIFDQSTDGNFAGAVSGTGQLIKNGSGTVTLSGANTYTGGTAINAGTLQGDTSSLQGAIVDNGTVAFVQNVDGQFSGAISGTGSLSKSGNGTLVLTGTNTYSGGSTISAGVLQGDANSLQGAMIDNATLAFAQASDGTFTGAISGSGQVIKTGAGTLVLSGTNSYVGGTQVQAGTLKGDTSSLQGDIVDNATVAFDQASDGTFAGVLSGGGQLVKDGTGTLSLTGANTYSGGTTISAGSLQGDTHSLQGTIVDNGTVVFAQDSDGRFNGVISGSGQLIKTGAGSLVLAAGSTYSGGTSVNAGSLQGDTSSLQGAIADNATLIFAQAANGVFNGTLSGAGQLIKNGEGTLVFDGISSFSGNTEVTAGKLVVGDDTHADASLGGMVTVDSAATLGGMGSIGGLDLSGTLTPGNSIGTLHVNGNVTFHPGSSYQFEVAPDGTGDRVAATGNVSILGGTALALASDGNWAPQTHFNIITAGGSITGQFDSITDNLAFLTPSLSYSANTVTLLLQRNDVHFDDVAQTRNQRAVAGAIDPLGMASPVYQSTVGLDAATARAGFDRLSGEQFASTRSALIDDSRYVRDAVDRHLLGLSNNGAQATDAQGVTAWTSAWGHWGDNDSDGNAARMQANGSGLLVGADLGIGSNSRLGAIVGHRQSSLRVDDRGSNAHATATDLGLYGDTSFGGFAVRGGVSYAWEKVDGTRTAVYGNVANTLSDHYHAHVAQGFVEGGYRFEVGEGQQLEPFLNLARVQLRTDATREGGGAAALTVAGENTAVNTATLGLRDTWSLDASGGLHAHASLGWQQAWGDLTPVSSMRFTGDSSSFDIAGVPVARHAGVVDAGLSFSLARNVAVDASYIGRFGNNAKDQGARMSLTVQW